MHILLHVEPRVYIFGMQTLDVLDAGGCVFPVDLAKEPQRVILRQIQQLTGGPANGANGFSVYDGASDYIRERLARTIFWPISCSRQPRYSRGPPRMAAAPHHIETRLQRGTVRA